eukprot:CAMPEP_0182421544 /NCGR_PEP_ID=MMETSP1167-20130531/6968_1 /TAXON_ID=2988 /ORGANISM="Mallomonas Sp, Strain CCMP3275" /LENGTH=836 /DNA_ID=CAMNT_0024598791 /DNA_START=34 /DNA_END=2544 /DNA_ORIENTATION=+
MAVESQTSAVLSTLTIYGAIGAILLLYFERVRNQSVVYFPRCHNRKSTSPARPPVGLFAWIPFVLSISDEETLRMVGMDAFVFLSILRFCVRFAFSSGLLGAVFLIPVYVAAPFNHDNPGIRRWSMGNINSSYSQLWTPWLFTYIFSFIFLGLLHFEYKSFATLRQKYLRGSNEEISQASYSVLLEGIPKKYRSNSKLKAFFEKLFPGAVHSAIISLSVPHLEKLNNERDSVIFNLELAIAQLEATGNSLGKFSSKGKPVMCCGKPGDLIEYYKGELTRLDEEIDELQNEVQAFENEVEYVKPKSIRAKKSDSDFQKSVPAEVEAQKSLTDAEAGTNTDVDEDGEGNVVDTKPRLSTTGFVTFTTQRIETAIYQISILDERYPFFKAVQAPQYPDVLWCNISTSYKYTNMAQWFTTILLDTGILFWAVIIAFIVTISQLAFLEEYLPFVALLDPVSYGILAGVLPVIILSVFLSLLPVIFAAIATYIERRKSVSDIQRMVFGWFFAYLLANVYLTLLSGSVMSSLSTILGDPTAIIEMLGAALPAVSLFFINYIIAQALMGFPMLMLRIGPLVIWNLLFLKCVDQKKLTRRKLLTGPLAEPFIDYGVVLPNIMYIVLITELYWVITPLIAIIATVYFAGSYLAYKYQCLYVFVPKFESGGMMWYLVYYRLNLGLVISAVAMIGYMGIKKGAGQTPLLAPLPFIIILCWRYTESCFLAVSQNMSYSLAADIDIETADVVDLKSAFSPSYYKQKCITAPHGEILPYRENDIPILTEEGEMDEIYYNTKLLSKVDEETTIKGIQINNLLEEELDKEAMKEKTENDNNEDTEKDINRDDK